MLEAMTPVEALKLLSQATGDFRGTRADHQMIIQAIQVLQALVDAQPKEAEVLTE